jgi:8-oxo-dGTP pyrophosphatase MutT (NUDIX family)
LTIAASTPRLAATVVVLRDGRRGLEALLLQRSQSVSFAPGAWVFPGGVAEPEDSQPGWTSKAIAERAAIRETREECAVGLAASELVPFAHWTTPESESKRFATWFFVAKAPLPSAAIIIDQSEMVAFRWLSPRAALDASDRGLMALLPPTFMALRLFQRRRSAAAVCSSMKRHTPHRITPQLLRHRNPLILLCDGDEEHRTLGAPNIGARHRVVGNGAGLEYIHSGDNVGFSRLDQSAERRA